MLRIKKLVGELDDQAKRIGYKVTKEDGWFILDKGDSLPSETFKTLKGLTDELDNDLEHTFTVEISKLRLRHPDKSKEVVSRAFKIPNQLIRDVNQITGNKKQNVATR